MDVEDVAAAAMQAVGAALKDEVESAAVVAATKQALAQTLKSLQALSPEPVDSVEGEAEVEAELAAAVADATASVDLSEAIAPGSATLASVDGVAVRPSLADTAQRVEQLLGAEASGVAAADGAGSASAAAAQEAKQQGALSPAAVAAAAKAASDTKWRRRWMVVGAVVAAGVAAAAFVQTPAGQSAIGALQALLQALLDKLGPIHVGEAERGILETIYLLLTSVFCVPAVCKLIPGGSPVLGYLVRACLLGVRGQKW